MIRYLKAEHLADHPHLAECMFRDRAKQFKDRLAWDVTVDQDGFEKDEYDALDPLYVIWETPDGGHGGSMRFLPTTGRTMVNEHFLDITGGVTIKSPLIWECTRFCLSTDATSSVSAALMLAGGEILRGFGLKHFVGVFDARMIRVYRLLGGCPEILGMSGTGADAIGVGLWEFSEAAHRKLLRRARISAADSRLWFDRAFAPLETKALSIAC